jgi:hypothetical protein
MLFGEIIVMCGGSRTEMGKWKVLMLNSLVQIVTSEIQGVINVFSV